MHENPQPQVGNGAGRGREAAVGGTKRNGQNGLSGGMAGGGGERQIDDRPWARDGLALYLTELERRERWPLG